MGCGTQERLSRTRVQLSFPGWDAPFTIQITAEMHGWPRLGFSPGNWPRPADRANTRGSNLHGSMPSLAWSASACGAFCCTYEQTRSQTVPLEAAQDVFQTGNQFLPSGARDQMHRAATISLQALHNSRGTEINLGFRKRLMCFIFWNRFFHD